MKKTIVAALALVLLALPAVAQETIKLGAFFDLSGRAAFIGTPTKLVAEMVVDKINAEGGINGRKLELIIGDTEANPAKAASLAKKFIHKDKVVAIIGPTMTDTGMAVKAIANAGKTPILMTVGGDPVIMGEQFGPFDWVFKSPQRSRTAVERLLGYLRDKGLSRIALLSAADGFGKDGAGWIERLSASYGIEIVARESFGARDSDMTAQLTKVRAAAPQALVVWTIGPAGAIVAKNALQLGLALPLFQCHGLPDPKYIELAGAASEGNRMPATKLLVADQLPDADRQKPVIAEFIRLYRERGYDQQFPINTHSGYAWDAILLLANAIRQAGTEAEALRQAIENTRDYVGVSGIYNLNALDHNGLDVDSMVMVEVKNGRFVLAD
ncbi:ABC transporter substrate-binding protein [Desulfuromonas thiophila]|uniref:Amino acid/amide ABC transporter substrate-binding protein, HAAT family n=1 Tax=Desulfuromonas thiophila TaxID=57664 RepID=A0A1G7CQH7_9BACT|nr:ABC transporter substrate-binding protein [Desulfuromonas thiophila]SDE41674.1 amino acid/amide ABC transporter substrate-binding protein, HAAT family [Desulfuromonas thiophila]